MNFLTRFFSRFSNGGAKVRIIFYFPNLFAKFFKLFFLRQSFIRTLHNPFFELGLQRYDFFIYFQIYSWTETPLLCAKSAHSNAIHWKTEAYRTVTFLLNGFNRKYHNFVNSQYIYYTTWTNTIRDWCQLTHCVDLTCYL